MPVEVSAIAAADPMARAVVERVGGRVVVVKAVVYQGDPRRPVAAVASTMLRIGD